MKDEETTSVLRMMAWISGTAITVTLVLFIVIPPLNHYLGKWSNYWDDKSISYSHDPGNYFWSNYDKASEDCNVRAAKQYNSDVFSSSASSTSSDFQTYDCHAIKLDLIK